MAKDIIIIPTPGGATLPTITFAGLSATNMELVVEDNGQVTFQNTGGGDVLTMTSTYTVKLGQVANNDIAIVGGNTGIGVDPTTVAEKLVVAGNIAPSTGGTYFAGTNSEPFQRVYTETVRSQGSQELALYSNNTTLGIVIDTSGVITFNNAYSFPTVDGATDYVLRTDGAGGVTWVDANTLVSGNVSGTGAANRVAYWSGTSALTSDADFTFDGTDLLLNAGSIGAKNTQGSVVTFEAQNANTLPRMKMLIGSNGTITNTAAWFMPDVAPGNEVFNAFEVFNANATSASTRRFMIYNDDTTVGFYASSNTGAGAGADIAFSARGLSLSNTDFLIKTVDGSLQAPNYGGGSITGTATYLLGVDTAGNIIEEAITSSIVTGTGTSGQVAYWSGTNTLTSEAAFAYDDTANRLTVHEVSVNDLTNASLLIQGSSPTLVSIGTDDNLFITADNDIILNSNSATDQIILTASGTTDLLLDGPTSELRLVKDSKFIIGVSGDMEIGHDGSNSFISNSTGQLNIASLGAGQQASFSSQGTLALSSVSGVLVEGAYTLPNNVGTTNYVMTTNGAGTATWEDVNTLTSGSGLTGGGSSNRVAYWTSGINLSNDAGFEYDPSINTLYTDNLVVNYQGNTIFAPFTIEETATNDAFMQFRTASTGLTATDGFQVKLIESTQAVDFTIGTGSGQSYTFYLGTDSSASQFAIQDNSLGNDLLAVKGDGSTSLSAYGAGSNTGTATYLLGVDSSGNIIEEAITGGTITGTGVSGRVTYWNGTNSITSESGFEYNSGTNTLSVPNLDVTGTTTTIDTTNLLVEDPLILLAKNVAGTPTFDSGFIIERGTTANAGIVWIEAADEFAFIGDTSEDGTTAGAITVNSYARMRAKDMRLQGTSIMTIDTGTVASINTNGALDLSSDGALRIFTTTTADVAIGVNNNVDDILIAGGTGAITFNNAYTFPTADGTTNYVLTTDGSGNVTWQPASAGAGALTGSGVANRVAYWNGTSSLTSDADLTFNGTTLGVSNMSISNSTIGSTGVITLSAGDDITTNTTGTVHLILSDSAGTTSVTGPGGTGPIFQLRRDDAVVTNGEGIGSIYFGDGDNVHINGSDDVGIKIKGEAAENWTTAVQIGSRLSFETVGNGTTTLVERMQINGDGQFQVGDSVGGSPYAFPLTSGTTGQYLQLVSANALDWTDAIQTSIQRVVLTQTSGQSGWAVTTGGATAVTFNNQDFIDAGTFTHSTSVNTSRIEVDSDGVYQFHFSTYITNPGANRITLKAYFRVNGVTTWEEVANSYSRGSAYGDTAIHLTSHPRSLTATDYVEVLIEVDDADGSATQTLSTTETSFSGWKVSGDAVSNTWRPITSTPVNGDTTTSISSDWAFDRGTGAANQVTYWSGTSSMTGNSGFTFAANTLTVPSIDVNDTNSVTIQANANPVIGSSAALDISSVGNMSLITSGQLQFSTVGTGNANFLLNGTNRLFIDGTTGAVTFNLSYEFPVTDGSSGYVLMTDGAGNVDWQLVSTGAGAYSSWNLAATNGGSTAISNNETVTFTTSSGITASRASNNITYDLGGVLTADADITSPTFNVRLGTSASHINQLQVHSDNDILLRSQGTDGVEVGNGSSTYKPWMRIFGQFTSEDIVDQSRIRFNDDNFGIGVGTKTGAGPGNDELILWRFDDRPFGIYRSPQTGNQGNQNHIAFTEDFAIDGGGVIKFNGAYTFPTVDGTATYVLQTNGSGVLSWVDPSTFGSSTNPGGANTQVQYNDSGSFGGDAQFTFNETNNRVGLGSALSGPTSATSTLGVKQTTGTDNIAGFETSTGDEALYIDPSGNTWLGEGHNLSGSAFAGRSSQFTKALVGDIAGRGDSYRAEWHSWATTTGSTPAQLDTWDVSGENGAVLAFDCILLAASDPQGTPYVKHWNIKFSVYVTGGVPTIVGSPTYTVVDATTNMASAAAAISISVGDIEWGITGITGVDLAWKLIVEYTVIKYI